MSARKLAALIAHRGASGYAPENTLASFSRALELGATSVEFDVQQTKDQRLVVIHDDELSRVAGLRRRVGSMSYLELSQVDVGSWFDSHFKGERVPLLEEVLDLFAGKVELHLEIKHGTRPYPGIEERVLELLGSRPEQEGKVVVSSFYHESLHRLRTLDRTLRLGFLVGYSRRITALREAYELDCESVHMSARQVDRAWTQALHRDGRKALVYTVNEPKEYERLNALGVDGVFTNYPDLGRLHRAGAPEE